jgi:adenylyltransferase/sulfurtransferase
MSNKPSYQNLTTNDVKAMLERGEQFRLIDVREPYEHEIAQIEGAELLPLSAAQEWINSLDQNEPIVFFCHHGSRSQQLASYAANQLGFTHSANMLGGIEEWSLRIDPTIPRY